MFVDKLVIVVFCINFLCEKANLLFKLSVTIIDLFIHSIFNTLDELVSMCSVFISSHKYANVPLFSNMDRLNLILYDIELYLVYNVSSLRNFW